MKWCKYVDENVRSLYQGHQYGKRQKVKWFLDQMHGLIINSCNFDKFIKFANIIKFPVQSLQEYQNLLYYFK